IVGRVDSNPRLRAVPPGSSCWQKCGQGISPATNPPTTTSISLFIDSIFEKRGASALSEHSNLLRVLKGERLAAPPVWLMRQAGRYLPEYRALRERKGGFLELVNDSAAAAEVTLQPIARFGFD